MQLRVKLSQICLGISPLHWTDSQGTMRDTTNPQTNGATSSTPPPVPAEFPSQLPAMTLPPFFQGFTGAPGQMPFMFPHSFMPHVHGMGFPPPVQGSPTATIDLTEGSQKRGSQDCLTDRSKPTKKKKVVKKKKKIEVVELDDTKEDVELMKQFGPWKDHWVIQLITVRSEMQNTFSAPPKQGIVCYQFVLYFVFFFSPKHISHICYVCSVHCSFIWCQHCVPSTAQFFWPNADAFCPILLCLPHFWPLLCTLFRLQSFHYRASGAEQKGFSL